MNRDAQGGGGGQKDQRLPETERQRLLRRLRADVQQVMAQVVALRQAWQDLLDLQAQRPLTAAEVERARALSWERTRLRYQIEQFYAEFAALQRPA